MAAKPTDWKCEPFKEGRPLRYDRTFTDEQFARIKIGTIPEQMEDKWFVYYEEPDLFFHRSWTGQPVYKVTLRRTGRSLGCGSAVVKGSGESQRRGQILPSHPAGFPHFESVAW